MTRASVGAAAAVAPLAAIALLLAMPSTALADNCSSLGDCWSTAAGAASAALGAAVGGIGGLFGSGGAGVGGSSGGGAGTSWPAPSSAPPPPPPPTAPPGGRWDHYPFAGPGEPTGEKAARQRVRDYMRDVRTGKAPPRTTEDAMRDLESVAPKLDLDDIREIMDREFMERTETARAIRG